MKRFIIQLCLTSIIFLGAIISTTAQEKIEKDTTIVIKVKGITCPGDCLDISRNVELKEGVTKCKENGKPSATTTFEITYNPSLVKLEDIIKAVESTPGCENPAERPYKVKQKKKD